MSSRGGRRVGRAGTAYTNRTDLTGASKLPIMTQPGAPYGESTQLRQAQQAVPMAGPQAPAAPVPAPQAAGGAAGLGSILGGLRSLTAPTRTANPVTHGLPVGPGGGPEVLQPQFKPDPLVQAAAAFAAVPAAHQTPIMRALAAATQASASNMSNPGIAPGGGQ